MEEFNPPVIVGAIIGILIAIIFRAIIARKFEQVAHRKGYGADIHSFAICFWFGIAGFLYIIALPNLNNRETTTEKDSKTSNEDEYNNDLSLIKFDYD